MRNSRGSREATKIITAALRISRAMRRIIIRFMIRDMRVTTKLRSSREEVHREVGDIRNSSMRKVAIRPEARVRGVEGIEVRLGEIQEGMEEEHR